MKRIYAIIAALAAGTAAVQAKPVTYQQAAAMAASVWQTGEAEVMQRNALRATVASPDAVEPVYVFNRGDNTGFLVIAGDDAFTRPLAYGTDGSFTIGDSSPAAALSWYRLAQRAVEDAWSGQKVPPLAYAETYDTYVEPLVEANYSQGSPFNLKCPYIDGVQCVTGCGATAMSQIVEKWKYPTTGNGSISYNAGTVGVISLDFSTVTFDWDLIKANYNSTIDDSTYAMATLLYTVGVAMKSDYGTASSTGTLTTDSSTIRAALNYLDYDRGTTLMYADYMPRAHWKDLVKGCLDQGMPMVYCGADVDGNGNLKIGHAFNVDGYDTEGYFHINWGSWGSNNGYFDLEVCNPKANLGTGTTEGDSYWDNQCATLYMQPPVDDSDDGWFMGADDIVMTPGDGMISVHVTGIYNFTIQEFWGTVGAKVVNCATGEEAHSITIAIIDEDDAYAYGHGMTTTFTLTPDMIGGRSGEYELQLWAKPGWKDEAGRVWQYLPDDNSSLFTLDGDNFALAESTPRLVTINTPQNASEAVSTLQGVVYERLPSLPGFYIGKSGKHIVR